MTPVDANAPDLDLTSTEARNLTDRIKTALGVTWELVRQAYQQRAWIALGYASWDDYCGAEFGASRLRLPREERQEVVASLRESGLSIRAIASATGTGYGTVSRSLADDPNGSPERQPALDGRTYPTPDEAEAQRQRIVEHLAAHPDHSLHKAAEATGTSPATVLRVRNEQNVGFLPDEPDEQDEDLQWAEANRQAAAAPTPPATPSKPRRTPLPDQAERAGWEFRRAIERIERVLADGRFPANREQVAAQLRGHLTYAESVMPDLLGALDTDPTEDR